MSRPPAESRMWKVVFVDFANFAPAVLRWNGSVARSPRCRDETWLESMPPSGARREFDSCHRLGVTRCDAGRCVHSKFGSAGLSRGGAPLAPQAAPPPPARVGLG